MLHKRILTSLIGIALPLSGLLLAPVDGVAQTFHFVTINVPCTGSACQNGIVPRTQAFSINPAGDIVGAYLGTDGMQHGYLLSGGQFTTIDPPNSISTTARGISPTGDIVGQYTIPVSSAPLSDPVHYCPAANSPACIKGFLYSNGTFSTILFPGHPGAIPGHITPDGSMYGCLHDFDLMGSMYSAAWTPSGDTSLAAGGGELSDPMMSYPNSMHGSATPSGNVIVGFYTDMMDGHLHGYILRNGMLQTWDFPDSTSTNIWDIDPEEDFVGNYTDLAQKSHGFLQPRDGSAPVTLDYHDEQITTVKGTTALGMNPEGAIVGNYTDTTGHIHGYLAMPIHGNH